MRKKIKHALIPHADNDYKPTLFHYASISAVLVIGIIFFVSSVAVNRFVTTTQQGAAVYSSVLVDLTNKARAENDASNLTISETLTKAAQMKADDMASRQYFAHTSPDGTTPWYWFQKSGYEFAYAGENLAVDFTESVDVENAWLASPKHRDNIVDSRFTEIGIATKTAMWQGRQTTFVVQLFGAPTRVALAAPTPVETKVVSENLNTIVVRNVAVPDVGGNATVHNVSAVSLSGVDSAILGAQANVSATTDDTKASFLNKTIVRIPNISNVALTALSLIVLLGLILFVFIEVKRQHPKHVIAGVVAFFILSTLAYSSHALTLFT